MADAAVSFALEQINNFLVKEGELDEKIKIGIRSLRRELEAIQAFVKNVDGRRGEDDPQVKVEVGQVRDQAYEIEDVLDFYDFHLAEHRAHWRPNFKVRHFIGELMDGINSSLKDISETKNRYRQLIYGQASSSSPGNYTYIHPRIAPLFLEDADIVGIEETSGMLTSWALEAREGFKVMFIVGMGGSGKTALVKKVYERVKTDFDCYAWIVASKSKKKLDILSSMFDQFSIPMLQGPEAASEVDLVNKARDHLLGKRYVIVLDDMWVKDVWQTISFAFPRRDSRGKVIITTRRGDIANSCRDKYVDDVYNMKPLPEKEAQQLFNKMAFPNNGRCPPQLEHWSRTILKKCDGLPLGIVEIGHYLSNREKNESEWKRLHDSLESMLKENGRLSNIMKVLCISYNDLPYHLKHCFLYLSTFAEEYPIKRRRLVRLWMAEGFIKEERGKQVEDIGEEYLEELIERSLVQAIEVDFDGKPRRCRVHNLMHKIILSKSQDENFCTVFNTGESLGGSRRNEKSRRISIQAGNNNAEFNMALLNSSTCARTVFMFGSIKASSPTVIKFSSSKLLRVLHLEGASLDKFPAEIGELLLLRYLCLSYTNITNIPSCVGKLQRLETLDLKQTLVREIPKQITNLNKLRHLLVSNYSIRNYVAFDTVKGFSVTKKIGTLTNLQKLSFVQANKSSLILAIERLTQLRKLGIIDLPKENGQILCHTIQRLQNLKSLNVTSLCEEESLDLDYRIDNPPLLRRLYLKGRLERMPDWISKLNVLVRIRLRWSKLAPNNNPIVILQDLPNLLELQLLDAYAGPQLDFNVGKFLKLKILELEKLEKLRYVRMENKSLAHLEKLIVRRCNNLVQVPVGIQNLAQLKQLHLYDMPHNFVTKLKKGGRFRHLVHRIPLIHAYYLQQGHHWPWAMDDLS